MAALARGWHCTGIDIINRGYPGHFVEAALPLSDSHLLSYAPSLIIASPPCEEFARHHLPWLNGPTPSTALLRWAIALADRLPVPVLIECSLFAHRHIAATAITGSYALWGNVPALLPSVPRRKARLSGTNPAARAMIEPILADWIIEVHT